MTHAHCPSLFFPSGKPVEATPQEKMDFTPGNMVRVQLDVEVFKAMQQGHGGWNDAMVEVQEKSDGGGVRERGLRGVGEGIR